MIIIDDFVQDKELLTAIREDLNKETPEFWGNYGDYSWYEGWWEREPQNLRERLIKYIYGDNCPLNYDLNIAGFEHWTGVQSASDKTKEDHLKQHFDKDEDLWHFTGEVRRPVLGTVYYPIEHDIDGGHLKYFDTYEVDFEVPSESIAPKPNRLVIFDAGKLHLVEQVTRGTRYAVAINLWDYKPVTIENIEQGKGTFYEQQDNGLI
jgi:hypothetical protein